MITSISCSRATACAFPTTTIPIGCFQTEVNARVGGGLQAEFNAKQAQQCLHGQISYISATNAFQNSLDDFKQKLSLPLGTDLRLDFNVLEQLDEIGLPPVAVSDEVGYWPSPPVGFSECDRSL